MIIEPNNCYNMDCEIGMNLMRTQGLKADWCITDPPYGIGADDFAHKKKRNSIWGGKSKKSCLRKKRMG